MATPAPGPLAACLQPVSGLPPPDLSLPALEPVKNRETYRARPEEELEEATWYSTEETDTLVEPSKIRLRSIHSKQATVITFANKSPFRVRALWVDFSGNEVVYSVLEPNSTRRYHTYQTHVWIVREVHSATRMILSGRPAVVGFASEQTVEITAPPQLQWSLDTFCCFPEPHKASVQGLLLAHKHLEEYAQQSSLAPLKVTPPCSPAAAVPCSPRATLMHQGALPTSPKAPRLSVSPMPTSPCPAGGCHTPRTPRAMGLAGSPAGSGDAGGTSSTTSISISREASHFTATLTVSNPTRAVLEQTVNIEVFNNAVGPLASHTVNFGTQLAGCSSRDTAAAADQVAAASPAAAGSRGGSSRQARLDSARKGGKTKSGLFNSLVHTFKHAFRPAVCQVSDPAPFAASGSHAASTTHITLHLSQLLQGAVAEPDDMEVDEPQPGPWPPVGTHLGHLPNHLLATIAEMAAPTAWQTLDQCPKGRPDILPTQLACPPKTAEEEAAEQQQQQDAANGNVQADDIPALI